MAPNFFKPSLFATVFLCLTGFSACPTLETTHIQFMNALKPGHAVAFICVILLCGTALYIYQDWKAQQTKHAVQPAAWQPPATDKIISEADAFLDAPDPLGIIKQKKSLTLDEAGRLPAGDVFDQVATNANGTPNGAWAATLVRITNAVESNLFSDPATGKLVHLVNGQFFEEKDRYMAMSPKALLYVTQYELDHPTPLQTHDYMNDYYQLETLSQNRQAIQEMQLMRWDYERNTRNH